MNDKEIQEKYERSFKELTDTLSLPSKSNSLSVGLR